MVVISHFFILIFLFKNIGFVMVDIIVLVIIILQECTKNTTDSVSV